MFLRSRRTVLLAALAGAMLVSGCARIREHRGYLMDPQLVSAIQPGVDNRDSVTQALGRPSFTSQFENRDWYYVSVDTRELGFNMPHPVAQTVLHIRFDPKGNVASVQRTGLEKVVRITPMQAKTPTLGRRKSFFEELFGNIGSVSPGGGAGGGGNPNQP